MPICSDRDGTDGPVVVENNEAIDKPPKNKKNTCPHGCNKSDTTVPCQCVVVGQLVILGYNGNIPSGESTRRKCKYTVLLRPKANGVKLNKSYIIKSSNYDRHTDSNRNHHSIVYTLPRYQTGIVEYIYDENTDLFQIGRSSEPPIDFVVMDTYPGNDNAPPNDRPSQSTISRFACRILIDRKNPKNARIYAAGFDNSKNIFLGEKATQWEENGDKIDGLTTNGVLIMHPRGPFCGGDSKCGSWREISIGGDVYSLRESRSAQQKGSVVKDEDNVLKDGTLIDLCGATLLWRSAEGLEKSPTKTDLEASVDKINAGKPQCPVGFNTLVIPRKPITNDDGDLAERQALVYLNCGHVQGYHMWRLEKDTETRECPLCRVSGPINKLYMGIEAAFYVDKEPPTFAFNPCGHMASEKTVKYWEKVQIPHGTNGYIAICPFCATPLEGSPGYVKLIFQDHIDNNQRDDNIG